MLTVEFVAPRRRLAEPIAEGFDAANMPNAAVAAPRAADRAAAADLIRQAELGLLPVCRLPVMGTAARKATHHRALTKRALYLGKMEQRFSDSRSERAAG